MITEDELDAIKPRVAGWLQRWLQTGVGGARFAGGVWIGAGEGDAPAGSLRLEGSLLGSRALAARASGGSQAVPSGVEQALAFSGTEHDPFGMFDGALPTVLRVPESGVYLLGGSAAFAAGGGGARGLIAWVNASARLGAQVGLAENGAVTEISLCSMAALNAGDRLELLAWQNSGAALAVETARAWIVRQA